MVKLVAIAIFVCIMSLAFPQTLLFPDRNAPPKKSVRRAIRGMDNPFEMPARNSEAEEADEPASSRMCPVTLSSSFDMIRSINNYRITHGLPSINISRSLMSTACAHMRDIVSSKQSINNECGLHSWSSCCYPSDHSNPNCMHRKALQVTTALKWNIFNVAAYELAYEWAGGPFSAVRALDMFVSNIDHRKFILQEDSWSEFKWLSIGAAVGERYAYIWFGTLADPNGDFDQFNVESHVMELPGCTCSGALVTWRPQPTLSPEQQAEADRLQRIQALPMMYSVEIGNPEPTEAPELPITTAPEPEIVETSASSTAPEAEVEKEPQSQVNATIIDITPTSVSASVVNVSDGNSSLANNSSSNEGDKLMGISLSDFLKGLTLQ